MFDFTYITGPLNIQMICIFDKDDMYDIHLKNTSCISIPKIISLVNSYILYIIFRMSERWTI